MTIRSDLLRFREGAGRGGDKVEEENDNTGGCCSVLFVSVRPTKNDQRPHYKNSSQKTSDGRHWLMCDISYCTWFVRVCIYFNYRYRTIISYKYRIFSSVLCFLFFIFFRSIFSFVFSFVHYFVPSFPSFTLIRSFLHCTQREMWSGTGGKPMSGQHRGQARRGEARPFACNHYYDTTTGLPVHTTTTTTQQQHNKPP